MLHLQTGHSRDPDFTLRDSCACHCCNFLCTIIICITIIFIFDSGEEVNDEFAAALTRLLGQPVSLLRRICVPGIQRHNNLAWRQKSPLKHNSQ